MKRKKNRAAILEIITKSDRETKKLGELFARTVLDKFDEHLMFIKNERALTLSLEGDLGSGKTTFAKGFAKGLRIRETIQSPTFVIAKMYQFFRTKNAPHPPTPLSLRRRGGKNKRMPFSRGEAGVFIHIDAYRIKAKDLPVIGWDEFIKNPQDIILIEWGERIHAALPKNHMRILFRHRTRNERIVSFSAK